MDLELKEELIVLLKNITDIQYENFQKTDVHDKVLHLNTQKNVAKVFTYTEQKILESEVRLHFDSFIKKLKIFCPNLTVKELLICCLSLRFPLKTISMCFGYSNINSIKQHKCRIKKKMTSDVNNAFLFDFIFKNR